jgi:UDP-N-acetylglucosamine--N-acetylmuramyl-(pentapeptide) pyrophosphoryl-undecaprenol N-acetylglucosamine transferase
MKILISGGHLTPAMAVIDFAAQHFPEDTFVFAGRLYSQPSLKQRSWEKEEVTKRGATFVSYSAPKLDAQPFWRRPFLFWQLLGATFAGMRLIGQHKPDIFLSFGGFLALPLAIAAKLRGVPIITHEQTRTVGVANRWIGKMADVIAVSFPESQPYFSSKKVQLTGNPLRSAILDQKAKKPSWLPSNLSEKPLLYITGGNQGSQFINVLVQECLPQLLEQWWVIHQCGNPTTLMNYKKSLEKVRNKLPERQQNEYFIREWVNEEELGWLYHHSAGVLSRSGANTVTELMTVGLPAVFIPLPQAHQDEQRLNAESMSDAQAAMILLQKDASAKSLVETLVVFRRKLRALTRHAEVLRENLPANPAQQLYQLTKQLGQK